MSALRTVIAGLLVGLAGFGGAHALASESPPLVANCVNAAEGWTVEVLGVDCTAAGKVIRRLTALRPKEPVRVMAGMTCTAGYARRFLVTIRCAGPKGRFVRANQLIPGAAKPTPLPPVSRCPDYVDKLKRRWIVRRERFGCADAGDILRELASYRPTEEDIEFTERGYNVGCWVFGNGGPPKEISCGGWHNFGSKSAYWGWFFAHVKLAPTPATTASTTTVRRP